MKMGLYMIRTCNDNLVLGLVFLLRKFYFHNSAYIKNLAIKYSVYLVYL
jgi:hypothetical protein